MTQMLSILMPTYNHEKYIAKAIESALMQKTSYSWELLIHDDCSTDNTKAIAREYAQKYPEKITLLEESQNQGLIKSYKALIDISKGKYLAILESDDYWIDENKIQKQIDFLEQNPDYGLVAGDVITVDEDDSIIQNGGFNISKRSQDDNYEIMLGNVGIQGAVNVVFRRNDFEKYCSLEDYISRKYRTFDHYTWLALAANTKTRFFSDIFSAYRVLSSSVSNSGDKKKNFDFNLHLVEIEGDVVKKYGYGKLTQKQYEHKVAESILAKSLKFHQRRVFCQYSKKIIPANNKQLLMKWFPNLYYWQFILRH